MLQRLSGPSALQVRYQLVGQAGSPWCDTYLVALLGSAMVGYLSWRGWTNIALFLLLIPALLGWQAAWAEARQARADFLPVLLALTLPVLALAISQALRQEWVPKAYDGPIRMLLAVPLLLYFYFKRIDFARILGCTAPLALLAMLAEVKLDPQALVLWNGRFATYFVDTDTFGVYGLVLTSFCLFSIGRAETLLGKLVTGLQVVGVATGIYLVIGSDTRTSWLALPFVLAFWAWLRGRYLSRRLALALGLAVSVGVILVFTCYPGASARVASGFQEFSQWYSGTQRNTSTGLRLTMWHISWELFKRNPWHGYGDLGYRAFLDEPWITSFATPVETAVINNGPHNELLANLLRSGVFGGIAVLLLFFAPVALFWRERHHAHRQVARAAQLGLVYLLCMVIMSIGFEMFTLKYTASFYGLVIAGLTAQVIRGKTDRDRARVPASASATV